jgi:ABC-type multidrug transport system fused ATPase/permease subunit
MRGRLACVPRALALGLALMTLNIYWITVIEVRWYTLDITSLPIFITPIFTLFVVALLNWLLRLYRGATLFTGAELTVVYIIMVTGAVFAGHDMLQNLFGTIAYLQRHGTPETGWRERFFDLCAAARSSCGTRTPCAPTTTGASRRTAGTGCCCGRSRSRSGRG